MQHSSSVQVDRQKVKESAFRAMQEHAHAMRALRVASALQLAQRPLPALIAVAALTDCPHELWKLLVWRTWRTYTVQRLRLQALAGTLVTSPDSLLLRRAVHAWTRVVAGSSAARSAGQPAPGAAGATSCTPSATAEGEAAETGAREAGGGELIEPGSLRGAEQVEEGSKSISTGVAWSEVADSRPAQPRRVVALLPPLWKDPLEKRVIMEKLPRELQLSSSRLKKRMQTMLAVKVPPRGAVHCSPVQFVLLARQKHVLLLKMHNSNELPHFCQQSVRVMATEWRRQPIIYLKHVVSARSSLDCLNSR